MTDKVKDFKNQRYINSYQKLGFEQCEHPNLDNLTSAKTSLLDSQFKLLSENLNKTVVAPNSCIPSHGRVGNRCFTDYRNSKNVPLEGLKKR